MADRYISEKALIENIAKIEDLRTLSTKTVGEAISNTPAADVVEVTRCKNCRYCFDAIMGGMWCEHPDNIMPLGSNPDDFCSYGKPKEETKAT